MKKKKAEQIEAKKQHIAALAAAKERRRTTPKLERSLPAKIEKPTILIVCEGRNTEPSYFRQFRLTSPTIKAIGKGYNTVSLVRQAITISHKQNYEQVWCAFDKDQFPANDFKLISEDFFDILNGIDSTINKPRIELAISRAKRNYNLLTHESPATEESSTTVFKLVEEILKCI